MNLSVLIVDDSLTVRMDLVEAFRDAGFLPRPCGTVAEARAILEQGEVALIVLDVQLPDGDGIEFMSEIQGSPDSPSAPIMLLSSEAEVSDRIRGLNRGADEYIGKPYERTYVVARACELLRNRQGSTPSDRATILLIDDSPTYREGLRAGLTFEGYDVLTAESGDEGLRLAATHRPSAILVDGILPGEDGTTIIRRIRLDAAIQHTPCILLTASEGDDIEVLALNSGADLFVRKEEDLGLLLAKLATILRGATRPDADRASTSMLGPNRILAVDDSVTYLNGVADELRQEGYEMVLAKSGEEAIKLLEVQSVDCILLDLLMPGMGGHETCRRIKADPKLRDIPLIMLTALEDREAMIEGLSVGADDYITKSGDFRVLKARVQAQIRRRIFENENKRIRDRLLKSEREAAEARTNYEVARSRAALVEELEQKNRELEAFSYSVSHDLRSPLRAIDGFSRVLMEKYQNSLPADGARYLSLVRENTAKMGQLIDDLLQFSRLSRQPLKRVRVSVTDLAREVVESVRGECAGRTVDIDIDELGETDADPALLRQVWVNLVSNAIKYSRRRERATIEIGRMNEDSDEPVYFVKDNGAGFDMSYAGKLFGVFQRLHRAEDFEGTGVGLATVQRIIQRHGGRIWAEAEEDKGATFFFTLAAPHAESWLGAT